MRFIFQSIAESTSAEEVLGGLSSRGWPTKRWVSRSGRQHPAPLARDGDPEPIHFEKTDTNFAIGWKGNYSVDGAAFSFIDNDSARIVTILGYPTGRIAQLG